QPATTLPASFPYTTLFRSKRYQASTARIKTMTRFHRFSALKAIALSAALSMTAGLAIADGKNVSSDQILNALQPKQLTRGMSAGPQADPAVKAKEISFIKTLR